MHTADVQQHHYRSAELFKFVWKVFQTKWTESWRQMFKDWGTAWQKQLKEANLYCVSIVSVRHAAHITCSCCCLSPRTCRPFKSSSRQPSRRDRPTWQNMTAGDTAGLCSAALLGLESDQADTPTHLQPPQNALQSRQNPNPWALSQATPAKLCSRTSFK